MRQPSTSLFGIELGGKGATTVRESKVDWAAMTLVLLMLLLGWLNLYSISKTEGGGFLDLSTYHGRQGLFILFSLALGGFILYLDTKFMEFVSYFAYGASLVLLAAVFTVTAVKGAASWFEFGGFKFQPTEFAKVTTVMALAKFMSRYNFSMRNRSDLVTAIAIAVVPMLMVLLQNDAGSSLVFVGLVFVFYRLGMHPFVLIGGGLVGLNGVLAVMFSDHSDFKYYLMGFFVLLGILSFLFVFRMRFVVIHIAAILFMCAIPFLAGKALKPHQSARLRVLAASNAKIRADKELDKTYYNLQHSMVAIGSGGFLGKGFGKSTHTRGDFVPEEQTDYIFCVVSEEHGFLGSFLVILMLFLLLWRLIYMAERAKSQYALVLGYGAAAIIFMHVFINVGMTIGLLPTVGIPLPFFSYGGSSTISFVTMMFVMQNHYSYRTNLLG
jgi:rod shape determining protein RodA